MPPKDLEGKRDWSHEGAMELSEVDPDGSYSGTVTNVGKYGVFVDFGAVKDALLRIEGKVGRRLKRGMELQGLAVLSIDPEAGRVVMEADQSLLPELPPRQRAQSAGPRLGEGGGRGGGKGRRKGSSSSRKPQSWDHDGQTPLEDLQVGDVFQGRVTNVSVYGVFVDIGAVRDARLNVPAKVGRRFRVGDEVEDVTLEKIDLEQQRMSATLPDADEAVRDLPPKERKGNQNQNRARSESPRPKAKAKAKAKAGSRARSSSPRPAHGGGQEGGGIAIEKLRVGAVVDGIVTNSNQYGVFVNIGCSKDAKLQVPKKLQSEFRKGDEVYGMSIETVNVTTNRITCLLEDPELSVEDDGKPQKSTGGGRASSRGPTGPKAPAGDSGGNKGRAAKAKAKPQERSSSSSAPPARRYKAGQFADGVVTTITPQGVFVDIGAAKPGVLKLPRAVAQQFQVGDEVHDMLVEAVRSANGAERITLILEDPELEESAPPPPKQTSKKASAKSRAMEGGDSSGQKPKAVGKAKAKAKSKDWTHQDGLLLSELEVGEEVEGSVTNVNNYGVFVDIGAVKDGRLLIPKEEWKKFRKGDRIEGMVIDHVDEDANQIGLGLTFELGDEPEEDVPPPPRQRPKPSGSSRPSPSSRSPGASRQSSSAGRQSSRPRH
eukprot:TRINITY_DN4347_c0_g1_i2.p1 TRINITY_DN4347_c0_g1~~TRINITY_DN4347_c0_g1_i2.p1  ORF type:complete len:658 (+),score=144.66 TRINITY_DN4347_c0_g1_i2:95-2068(+)